MNTDRYPNNAEVREWARGKRAGASVKEIGRFPRVVILAWNKAHPDRPYVRSQAHHGTKRGYDAKGCRCDRCRAAKREYDHNLRAAGGVSRWDFDDDEVAS